NIGVPYLPWDDVVDRLNNRTRLDLGAWEQMPGAADEQLAADALGFTPAPAFGGRLDQAVDVIRTASLAGTRVVIATTQDQRMRELLLDADLYPMHRTSAPPRKPNDSPLAHLAPPPAGAIELIH